MDFDLDEDLRAVRDLTEQIFADHATVDRVREVEREEDGHDPRLWRTLADAGVLGIALPEGAGGAGLGVLGLVTLLEQQGRRVAPVPLWAVLATAALPIAELGSDVQRDCWLPGLLDGSVLVTGAFDTAPGQLTAVRAEADGERRGGWRLHGEVLAVPGGPLADAVVVPARTSTGEVVVAIVPTDREGVRRTSLAVTSHESSATVSFDGVPVDPGDLLPGDGAVIVPWVLRRARVALAAVQLGVCAQALSATAAYTSQRVQFGRPLSTNQAVAVRAADGYLDTERIRLTTYHAAWLLDGGREEEAESAALVAKYWAAEGGLRVVHATQHLHGGIGADVDYPVHRYFLWGRQLAFSLGSAAATAAALGDVLGTAPAVGAAGPARPSHG